MRGTVAKRLRKQANEEAKEQDNVYYFTGKGEKSLTIDCFRGRYQALKQMHYYAKRFYKVMPKLQIIAAPESPSEPKRDDLQPLRSFLDFPQG